MSTTELRRTRDAERSKIAILDAAERLFAARGYQGTSLQDIGDAAGVSRGTPSYFFGSKDGLYRAVLERNFTDAADNIRRIREEATARGESAEQVLTQEIEGSVDFLTGHPTFVRLVQWEALTGGETIADLASHLGAITETLNLLRGEMARAPFRPVDPVHLTVSLVAMVWFPVSQQYTLMRALELDPFDPDFVEARKRHVVDLILNGILPRQ